MTYECIIRNNQTRLSWVKNAFEWEKGFYYVQIIEMMMNLSLRNQITISHIVLTTTSDNSNPEKWYKDLAPFSSTTPYTI